MHKIITTFLVCFVLTQASGQANKKTFTYLIGQFNSTISDITKGNNPWSMGLGFQTIFNNKSKFKPAIELTGDLYLADDKVFRTNIDGTPIEDVSTMVNLFAGVSFHPTKQVYLLLLAGPSFINGQVVPGIKPSIGFYFSKSKKWTGKISYIYIYNRDKTYKEDFSSLSFAIGRKIF